MRAFALSFVLLTASPVAAQDAPPPAEKKDSYVEKVEAAEAKDGVRWHLDTGATFNPSDNRSVIGQPDGTTATFGYKSALGVELREGPHEWRNTASTAAGVTYTPVVPDIVKSRDLTEAETIYLFHIIE